MCGICGIINNENKGVPAGAIARMQEAIRHRGPDGEGRLLRGRVGLGHRRLSIIDLSAAAAQPMSSEDETLWLVFNGEIYNYIELRKELQEAGHRFRSRTDSEVVLHGYEQWGEDCLRRFNGMWAFAIYDAKDESLFFARDRFGIKPFYYYNRDDRFIFASEIKAILAVAPEAARANLPYLGRFFTFSLFDDGEDTFFTDVKQIRPAHFAKLKNGTLTTARYWDFEPEVVREEYDFENPERTLRDLLTDSVRLRLRSDVPVGTCLSGGLDSSSIVSIANNFFSTSINTFSSLYDETDCDESRYVDAVNAQCSTTPHPVRPKPEGFMEVMKDIVRHQDEPSAGPGIYSQWHVMQEAHGTVKVLLDGQGGDEILAGYFPYYRYYAAAIWKDAIHKMSPRLLIKFFRENKIIKTKYPQHNPLKAILDPLTPGFVRALYKKAKLLAAPRLRTTDVLADDFAETVRREKPPSEFAGDFGNPLDNILYAQLTRSSIPALLHYEDRNAMAFSIEARTPFLDYRMVEFCLALPYDIKIRRGVTKHVLREAMRGILPDAVVERQDKMGYPTPVAKWFRNELYDELRDTLLSKRCTERGVFSKDGLDNLLILHKNGGRDAGWELFRILTTELWFRKFIDGRD